jgi:hypothetical protein
LAACVRRQRVPSSEQELEVGAAQRGGAAPNSGGSSQRTPGSPATPAAMPIRMRGRRADQEAAAKQAAPRHQDLGL